MDDAQLLEWLEREYGTKTRIMTSVREGIIYLYPDLMPESGEDRWAKAVAKDAKETYQLEVVVM